MRDYEACISSATRSDCGLAYIGFLVKPHDLIIQLQTYRLKIRRPGSYLVLDWQGCRLAASFRKPDSFTVEGLCHSVEVNHSYGTVLPPCGTATNIACSIWRHQECLPSYLHIYQCRIVQLGSIGTDNMLPLSVLTLPLWWQIKGYTIMPAKIPGIEFPTNGSPWSMYGWEKAAAPRFDL